MVSAVARGRRRAFTAYAVVALVGAGALVGVVLAANAASTRAHPTVLRSPAAARGDDLGRELRTSFGVIAATSVQHSRGLTAKELSGLTHFPSYVPPDRMQVRVSLQLTNTLDRPIHYSARQFLLRAGIAPPIAPAAAGVPFGTLQPDAAVDQTLSFVVPRTQRRGVRLTLEFRESGTDAPLVVRLGTVRDAAAPPPAATRDHTGHGRSPP